MIPYNWWPGNWFGKQLRVFETEVGVKYKYGRFDSNRFVDYALGEVQTVAEGWSFADLLLPPDLLRDPFTLCGKSILESPHYSLIAEIASGRLSAESDYVARSRKGTLDARLPCKLKLQSLIDYYAMRKAEISHAGTVVVSVVWVPQYEAKYIIADGKHRAALAAYLNQPELLRLRMISPRFAKEPFFQSIYSYILRMDADNYSINQKMIRALTNES